MNLVVGDRRGGIASVLIPASFKLGQNRTAADQVGMLAGLRGEGGEAARLAEFIAQRLVSGSVADTGAAPDGRGM
jgi:hypothetical protein